MISASNSRVVRHAIITVLASVLSVGCASSALVAQRYALPQLTRGQPVLAEPLAFAVQLQLTPVRLATYLDTRGLLYQSSEITLSEASGHLWAENLGAQLTRAMCQGLAAAVMPLQVREASQMTPADPSDYRLGIQVERFQGRHDGYAVVSGIWSLRDSSGQLLESRAYRLEEILTQDGYPALVRSLDQAWQDLALQIAEVLVARDGRITLR